MAKYTTLFDIGDKVHIDQGKDIVGVITTISILNKESIAYKVCWFHNDGHQSEYIEQWRLTSWEE